MQLNIKHRTLYTYGSKVFLEPHHLYFHPLQRAYIQVEHFDLRVLPAPAGTATRFDAESNRYQQCWFNDQMDALEINVNLRVNVSSFNQFNYFVEEGAKTNYQAAIELYRNHKVALKEEIIEWLNTIGKNGTDFLSVLCSLIHEKWDHSTSYESNLMDPNHCFNRDSGSCRDLSWMMIQMLRYKGYPARFVSGYSHNPEIDGHELHAWVEAWLPGAGWLSLDPSSGLFTTETYIPVVASYHPVNTLPVQGSYRGAVPSKLETHIEITAVS